MCYCKAEFDIFIFKDVSIYWLIHAFIFSPMQILEGQVIVSFWIITRAIKHSFEAHFLSVPLLVVFWSMQCIPRGLLEPRLAEQTET